VQGGWEGARDAATSVTGLFQATGHHHRPDGTPRDLSYIRFITRRDGKVTRWQDYMNPLQLSARAR
jgi:uncharacterized protein